MTSRPKNKGATDRSVAPRLVPSPRYFAKFKLLQLLPGRSAAGRMRNHRSRLRRLIVSVDDAVFVRAERVHARCVERSRRAAGGVIQERGTTADVAEVEIVATLLECDCGGL